MNMAAGVLSHTPVIVGDWHHFPVHFGLTIHILFSEPLSLVSRILLLLVSVRLTYCTRCSQFLLILGSRSYCKGILNVS